jgi:hypothetical protein
MKLFNRTKLPNKILSDVLVAAGRSVGARTARVVIQVNPAKYGLGGCAYRSIGVVMNKRKYSTDGGWFKIAVPLYVSANEFFEVAQHEWVHIKDYQEFNPDFSHRCNGRRPRHDDRPEEIRAIIAVKVARRTKTQDELIRQLNNYICEVNNRHFEKLQSQTG